MEYFLIGLIALLVLVIWILLGFAYGITSAIYGEKVETPFGRFIMWPMNVIAGILGFRRI